MSVDESKNSPSPQIVEVKRPEVNAVQKAGYDQAQAALAAANEQRYIDLGNVHRILDFGAGLGGPTFGIIDTTRQYSPHVDAVEKEKIWIDILNQLGILPPENVIHDDGILYLKQMVQRHVPPYDLITAFRLGPDGMGRIFREVAANASTALNPNGNLLITSDSVTINAAIKACEEANVPYHSIDEITEGPKLIRPYTLIVSQSSCTKIQPLNIPASLL